MKTIYIVLIAAHTGLGKIVRRFTSYPYTHIAVSFDPTLTDFVTYSRRRHYVPLDAGFMHEYRDYYAFGTHMSVPVKIFALPVSDDAYERILRFIEGCESDSAQMFNLFSMVTMPMIHGFRIYKTHNCMSFAAKILLLSGKVPMERPYWRYDIREMDRLLSRYFRYEGNLKRMASEDYEQYMKKPPLSHRLAVSVKCIGELLRRCIAERDRIED